MRAERKQMIIDCGRAMNLTAVTYGLTELISGLLTTYTAAVLGEFADTVLTLDLTAGREMLLRLLLCILQLAVVLPVLSAAPELMMFSASLRHERMVFRRFLNKKYSAFRSMEEGDLTYLVSEESNQMRIYWTFIVRYLIALPFLTIYLFYCAFRVSVIYTFVVFAISLFKLFAPIAVRKLRAGYDRETRTYKKSRRNLEVMLTGQAWMVRIYGIQKGVLKKLSALYEDYYGRVLNKSAVLDAVTDEISKGLDTFCVLLILVCGVILAANGRITVGVIAAMYGYFTVFDLLIGYVQYLVKYVPILYNIFDKVELLYRDPEEDFSPSADRKITGEFQRLDCENLSFSYGDTKVFEGLNLSLKKGEKLLLTGENGSGKTTLFRILCGLEDDYGGKLAWFWSEETERASETQRTGETETLAPVYLHRCGDELSPVQLRRRAAVVERDDYLFEGSVRENVRLGDPDASDGQVDAVLKQLGISHLADRLVGTDHKNLSGGEQKRVAIARALLKDADIFFLDEPDNGLDQATRAWLIRWLNETERTVVLVSHDPELVTEIPVDCQFQMGI